MSVAQRLVRKLCTKCKTVHKVTKDIFPEYFVIPEKLQTHYVGVGCQSCHFTGYSGRMAIYEILPITKELQLPIKNNQLEIESYLLEKSIATLQNNAIGLVAKGITSIEEIYPMLIE